MRSSETSQLLPLDTISSFSTALQTLTLLDAGGQKKVDVDESREDLQRKALTLEVQFISTGVWDQHLKESYRDGVNILLYHDIEKQLHRVLLMHFK